ncbi:MAG TPA: EVE domain-containing protein [Candidatus Hodarchaeales archaeon]|nr:EVE domain-containing protein [Candidatus Hodarchaeales archaeon]
MNYWIFKCNPEKYNIDKRLMDHEPTTTWRVTRYRDKIAVGDIAFIWRTGKDGGIRAVIRIDSEPQEMSELDHERKYCTDIDVGARIRVHGTIINRFECLSHIMLRDYPGLEDMSVFRGFKQATNFFVTQDEGKLILRLIQGTT